MRTSIEDLITLAAQVNATPYDEAGTYRATLQLSGMVNALDFRLTHYRTGDHGLEFQEIHSFLTQLPSDRLTWSDERDERLTETIGEAVEAMRGILERVEVEA